MTVTDNSEVIANMQNRIAELEQQNAESVAHCEVLRIEMDNLLCHYKENLNGGTKHMNELIDDTLNQTTKQSLANIKADAIQEFADSFLEPPEYTLTYGTLDYLLQNHIREIIVQSK